MGAFEGSFHSCVLLALFLSCLCHSGDAYRPIILMHGILDNAASLSSLVQRIQQVHPATAILNVDLFDDLDSITRMWSQVKVVEGAGSTLHGEQHNRRSEYDMLFTRY